MTVVRFKNLNVGRSRLSNKRREVAQSPLSTPGSASSGAVRTVEAQMFNFPDRGFVGVTLRSPRLVESSLGNCRKQTAAEVRQAGMTSLSHAAMGNAWQPLIRA